MREREERTGGAGAARRRRGMGRSSAWLAAVAVAVAAAAACGGGEASGREDARAAETAREAGGEGEAARAPAGDTALAALLAELLPSVEESSGMEALRPPRLGRADRERLRSYLREQLEAQLPLEKARRMTAAYARFGLVPETLDLRGTLSGLYQEQVVGYYDPEADTLFVLEDVPAAQLEAVLSHELVHALQDQHVDLDSLVRAQEGFNDRGTAVQAAVEGHATLAMLELQLGQMMGRKADVTRLPDLGEQLQGIDLSGLGEAGELPALQNAPRVIREALVFPYVDGLSFVQRLWKARPGRPPPFGEHLPLSTEQILHPDRFLGDRDPPAAVRFTGSPPDGWEEVHADGLGELETRIFLEEHLADDSLARAAAAGWDGDRYRLLRGAAGEVLVWATVWDDAAEADAFASASRRAWDARYGRSAAGAGREVRVERLEADGRAAVLVLDVPSGYRPPTAWPAAGFEVR